MRKVITFLTLIITAWVCTAAPVQWEQMDRMPQVRVEQCDDASLTVSDGWLYVSLRQRTAVKLFTILGQPVVQDVLPAGVHRFRIPTRGIYLLKLGSTTRRITS
ncbi:MAG: hypothetical protein NC338_09015 [Firmicutes bacterium]|nr:hypothetical protein [Bacillota bacterium]MCM1402129.1 hypothetical protein [Bacteroides sp.]MCM1478027.1 hypothetical protein [Bacteroides sp.]